MIQSDNHVHTSFSSDSTEPMENMIKQGITLGLTSICFTEHMDYDFPDLGQGMDFLFDVPTYLETLQMFQKQYNEIEIRKGVEIGLKSGIIDKTTKLTTAYDFDFVIGSTHLVNDMDPYYRDYWESTGETLGIQKYYETTLEQIQNNFDFDVYGHIDYILRYTPTVVDHKNKPNTIDSFLTQSTEKYMDILDEILRTLIENGKGIEINAAGWKYGLGHPNPHEKILTRYRELGGEIISIGSDAHETKHLAYDFHKVPNLLKTCGFDYYTEFHGRKPKYIKL